MPDAGKSVFMTKISNKALLTFSWQYGQIVVTFPPASVALAVEVKFMERRTWAESVPLLLRFCYPTSLPSTSEASKSIVSPLSLG